MQSEETLSSSVTCPSFCDSSVLIPLGRSHDGVAAPGWVASWAQWHRLKCESPESLLSNDIGVTPLPPFIDGAATPRISLSRCGTVRRHYQSAAFLASYSYGTHGSRHDASHALISRDRSKTENCGTMAHKYMNLLFSIIYGSAYIIFYIILVALVLVTPADAIQRSIKNEQRYNVIFVTVCYVATTIIVLFGYAVRLYVNKTVLASIPKGWVPIDKGDLKKQVYKIVSSGLDRSALIASEAKPRIQTANTTVERTTRKLKLGPEGKEVELPPARKPWGDIEHRGWASPNSPDLPNLQFSTVLSELPNLIEAKALTLAPTDTASQDSPPMLDPEAVGLLQRPPNASLRDYINHLAELGVLEINNDTAGFLRQYEYSRFSNRPISTAHFRELMHRFAETLRAMRPLDLTLLDPAYESDIDNNGPIRTASSTPQRMPSRASSSPASVRRLDASWYATAPNTPRRQIGPVAALSTLSRKSSSSNSFAQTRQPFAANSRPSTASSRSTGSASVIRLAAHGDPEGSMYVLNTNNEGLGGYN